MAKNDLVVHLMGDNSNLQASLNQVKKALADTGQASEKLEDIQKKFQKISNSSASLSRKLSDTKKAMERLAQSEAANTEEGKKLWEQLANAAKGYDQAIKEINRTTKEDQDVTDQLKGKVAELRKEMERMALTGQDGSPMFQQMAKQVAELEKAQKKASDAVDGSINKNKGIDFKAIGQSVADKAGLGGAFSTITAAANPATVAIAATAGTMVMAGKAAADFENHLDDLQALTKVSDKEISAMGDTAVQMSKKFGTAAGSIVDSMGVIGSQAPELLKDAEALSFVTDAAMTLGKAGSISAEAAASAITTVMNQMGVASSEALNIANTLEAAEQQGSASVEYLNKAIEKSGTIAKQSGMSYVDLASMIETIAPKFSSADVAGSNLNSTLLQLTQAEEKFNPAIVGVTQALKNLNEAHLSNAELAKMVGSGNLVMLNAMMEEVDAFQEFQDSIDGTNAAVESWQTKTGNMTGAVDRLKTTWDAFLITLGQSGLIQGIADNIMTVMSALGEVIDVISEVIDAFDDFGGEGIQPINLMKVQLDILIGVIKAVGEVVTVIVKIISKAVESLKNFVLDCVDWIGDKWSQLKKNLGDVAFVRFITNAFESILRKAMEVIGKVQKAWNDFKKFLGMKVETNVTNKGMTPAQRKAQEAEEKKRIAEDARARNAEAAARKQSTGSGSKGSGSSKSSVQKVDYLTSIDDGSLDTAEKKLQAFTNKKKSLPITATAELEEADTQIKKWTEEIQRRKIALTVEGREGLKVIDSLEKELADLRDKKTKVSTSIEGAEDVDRLKDSIEALQGKEVTVTEETKVSTSIEGAEDVDRLKDSIEALQGKEVTVTATVNLDAEIAKLESRLLREKISLGIIPEIEEGSVTDIEQKIKKLEEVKTALIRTKADPTAVKEVEDEVKALKKELEEEQIRVGVKPFVSPDSLNGIKAEIKKKEEELALLLNTDLNPDAISKVVNELDDLRKREKEKSIELGISTAPTIAPKEEKMVKGSTADKRQSLSNANSIADLVKADYKVGIIGKEEAIAQLKDLDKMLAELQLKPLNLHVNDDGTITSAMEELAKYKEQMDATADVISNMGNMFGSLGDAIGGSAGEVMSFAGNAMNAIAQILPQIATLIAAKQAESTASLISGASQMQPWPVAIAAVASSVATIASLFASLPKFESGGIVGGSSFTGDKLLARVNSGEMILNRNQQTNLYNTLAGVGAQRGGGGIGGDVNFRISGTSLKGTLRNYDRKTSRLK